MEELKYTEILQRNKELAGTGNSQPYTIGILSNVIINSIKEILEYSCRTHHLEPNIEAGNYDNIVQDSTHYQQKDLVIVFYDVLNIIDQVSEYFEDIDEQKYISLRNKIFSEIDIILENLKNTPSVVFNSFSSACFAGINIQPSKSDQFVDEINTYLNTKKSNNVTIVNIDQLFIHIGLKRSIDYRFYHSSKAPYSFEFFKWYVLAIEPLILKNTGKLKKAIIFDCDNTLWKGIIGEDGIDAIDMSPTSKEGRIFHKVQQIAVYLSKRGVLVGICSKNIELDVLEVFKNHKDMVLKEEHIVIKKINWVDKVDNIKSIASELNIGIDSLVFVDDSSFEINLIKEQIPEVHTIQVPAAIYEYPDLLLKSIRSQFSLVINSDDARKTEMYKQQYQREESKKSFTSIEDYLALLGIELTVFCNNKEHIPRISQLTQKTNQFNLTTHRYTESQIEAFLSEGNNNIYSMSVKDKYGDNGLTGVCIVKEEGINPKKVIIDTLLMSCRIIGRNIEIAYVDFIINDLTRKGYEVLTAEYIPTKKNEQVADFYEKMGLHLIHHSKEIKQYELKISEYEKNKIEYIKVSSQ